MIDADWLQCINLKLVGEAARGKKGQGWGGVGGGRGGNKQQVIKNYLLQKMA